MSAVAQRPEVLDPCEAGVSGHWELPAVGVRIELGLSGRAASALNHRAIISLADALPFDRSGGNHR